jgi:hypothetical protein
MNILKPPKHPKPRRIPKAKPVTVCIAGIHEYRSDSSILLVCDRRISMFGGWFSQDGYAKFTPLHRDWYGMFAGGVEETKLMLGHASQSLAGLPVLSFENVVECCRRAYTTVRKRLIETQILPDFDILTYQEFRDLEKTAEALYLTIQAKIKEEQEHWSLLFAGFDNQRIPHLFVISGAGTVEYHESQKVAAIGSGAFAALIWLGFYDYHFRGPLGHALFGILSAKFFAERAQDVGKTTVASLIKSGINGIIHLNESEIDNVRQSWEELPKYSDVAAQELQNRMEETERVLRAHFDGKKPVAVVNALKQEPKT